MNTVALERPRSVGAALDDRQRRVLLRLLRRLERWLPAEEAVLERARRANRPLLRREAEWRELLKLYERLCTGLGPLVDVEPAAAGI